MLDPITISHLIDGLWFSPQSPHLHLHINAAGVLAIIIQHHPQLGFVEVGHHHERVESLCHRFDFVTIGVGVDHWMWTHYNHLMTTIGLTDQSSEMGQSFDPLLLIAMIWTDDVYWSHRPLVTRDLNRLDRVGRRVALEASNALS